MNRLKALLERYKQAQADVDASNAEIRRASSARLRQLLATTSAGALVAGLNDPVLIEYDRLQLENAIADRLPRGRARIPLSLARTLGATKRHARYHMRAIAFLTIVAMYAAGIISAALHDTPELEASLLAGWTFHWRFPDGHVEASTIEAGAGVAAFRGYGDTILLRLWDPHSGYLWSTVSSSWLAQNARVWEPYDNDR